MDQNVYKLSRETQNEEKPFTFKQWEYINDNNNGSYNGQIVLDTSSISNSGSWCSFREGVLKIPIIVTLTGKKGTTDINWTTVRSDYLVGLKSGHHQLISSIQVEYNNGSLINSTTYTNMYVSYKLNTTMSESDLAVLGPSIGFYPDSSDSVIFRNDQPTSFGIGSCNNSNFQGNFWGSSGQGYNAGYSGNDGFVERQKMDNFVTNPVGTADFLGADVNDGYNQITDSTKQLLINQNRIINTTAYSAMYITATIRLRDLHDFFEQYPLSRGGIFKFTINTNTPQFTVSKLPSNLVNGTNPSLESSSVRLLNGVVTGASNDQLGFFQIPSPLYPVLHFDPSSYSSVGASTSNPVMVSSCFGSSGFATSGLSTKFTAGTTAALTFSAYNDAVTKINVSVSIQRVVNSMHNALNVTSHSLPCRLYVPLYTMNEDYQKQYMGMGQKKFNYTDILSYVNTVGPGNNFSIQVATGLKNVSKIIVIPIINDKSNCVYSAAVAQNNTAGSLAYEKLALNSFSPLISPFSSEPATSSPLCGSLTELNVRLGGKPVLSSNSKYNWEMFYEQLYGDNSLNGSQLTGVNSGLVNERNWRQNYNYYVFDCSRFSNTNDMPQGIELIGQSNSKLSIDLYCFVEQKKEFVIDVSTGARL